jgi:hypothetical protein
VSAVSRWPLDENTGTAVSDSVGSNTGTLSNAAAWTTTVAPVTFTPNDASILCSGGYFVDLANGATLGVTSSYSFSMWLMWPTPPSGFSSRNAAFGICTTSGAFELGIGSSFDGDGTVAFDVGYVGGPYQSARGPTIVANQWYHVGVVLKNGSAELWVDGVLEDTVTYDANTLSATDNADIWRIGGELYATALYYGHSGYVDDVRTFDHELGSTEWAALAARASTTTSLEPGVAVCAATAVAPSVIAGGVSVAAGVAVCAGTAVAPTVSVGAVSVAPGVATCAGTAVAPTVSVGAVSVAPGVATCAGTAVAPTVTAGAVSVAAGVAVCAATAVAPTVTAGAVSVALGVATCVVTAVAPTVTAGSVSVSVALGVATCAATAVAPTVTAGAVSVAPGVATCVVTAVAPTVTTGSVSVVPGVASCAVTVIAPTVANVLFATDQTIIVIAAAAWDRVSADAVEVS